MRSLLGVLMLVACTSTPSAVPTDSPTPTPTPTRTARVERPAFDPARAQTTVRALTALGPREAASRTYARAATLVARTLRSYGYDVARERFDVPAGTVDGDRVEAGESENVVATPPGFRGRRPHLVVGAHLDSVPDSPGANDNASGVAVLVELARLAIDNPTRLPITFVALGAEERRRQGDNSVLTLGAKAYLTGRDPDAIRGFMNLDMVGNGPRVTVIGEGALYTHTLARARRIDVPTALTTVTNPSDHRVFADAGITVAWLYSGPHPSWHTPEDTASVVKTPALRRAGRLGWESLRSFRG